MESNLLKVFVAVANKKSISLGAQTLNFTQSNVTNRIKQLEKNLEYLLFHRVPSGVILTKEGEKLYPLAVEIVKKVEEAQLKMQNINFQDTLRIGSGQANVALRLLPFINKLTKKFPNMELEFYVNANPQILEKLLDYKLDIAFTTGFPNHGDLISLKSFDDDLFLIEPKFKNYANCLIGYKKDSSHYKFLVEYEKSNDNNEFKTIFIENYEVMLGCVKNGMGKAYVSKKIIEKYGYMNELNLTKLKNEHKTHLVCRKDYIPLISSYLKEIQLI
ncbi:LysR family transcriptional regulator [Poseidonibacter sp.]|uniref:LysR family transcriptional regulator n=1 Tax=Poseidonibacter sp. TaxID=2321188 RepID=UPI003C7738FC